MKMTTSLQLRDKDTCLKNLKTVCVQLPSSTSCRSDLGRPILWIITAGNGHTLSTGSSYDTLGMQRLSQVEGNKKTWNRLMTHLASEIKISHTSQISSGSTLMTMKTSPELSKLCR